MRLETALMMVQNFDSFPWNNGQDAKFGSIDGEWGVKIFKDEVLRDKTYDLQKYAASFGLAPQIGEVFETFLPWGETAYGYTTEMVEWVCQDMFLMEMGYDGPYDPDLSIDDHMEFYQEVESSEEFLSLLRQIREIGISTKDIHWGNVGRLSGELVCIDFSDEKFV